MFLKCINQLSIGPKQFIKKLKKLNKNTAQFRPDSAVLGDWQMVSIGSQVIKNALFGKIIFKYCKIGNFNDTNQRQLPNTNLTPLMYLCMHQNRRHGRDMAETGPRHGQYIAKTWTTHELNMDQTCTRHCPDMAQTWPQHGSYMIHTWCTHDPHMVHKWQRHGPDMAQTWPRHCPDITQTWPRHGQNMAKTWSRHGSDMLQTWP